MGSVRTRTIAGCNAQLAGLRAEDTPLTEESYRSRASIPLIDAAVGTMRAVRTRSGRLGP